MRAGAWIKARISQSAVSPAMARRGVWCVANRVKGVRKNPRAKSHARATFCDITALPPASCGIDPAITCQVRWVGLSGRQGAVRSSTSGSPADSIGPPVAQSIFTLAFSVSLQSSTRKSARGWRRNMFRLSVCAETVFPKLPLAERAKAIAREGAPWR